MSDSTSKKRRTEYKSVEEECTAALQVAIVAARKAGEHMKNNIGKTKIEKTKSCKDDLVTVVDKQCQSIIEETIKEKFPYHEFLGEENVLPGSVEAAKALESFIAKEWLWIVDPIDGTTNFVHGRPASVVSVGLAHKGDLKVGVIYDPYLDELFSAQSGKGAYCNGKLMKVSSEEKFDDALIGFGIGVKESVRLPMLRCINSFASKCRAVRLQGSSAKECAWVAYGRQTGFYELDLCAWDIAAGVVLVREAGGKVSESTGAPYSLRTRNLVVSNGKGDIHQEMLDRIKNTNAQVLEITKKN